MEMVGPRPQLLDGDEPGRPWVAMGGDVSGQAGPYVGTDNNKVRERNNNRVVRNMRLSGIALEDDGNSKAPGFCSSLCPPGLLFPLPSFFHTSVLSIIKVSQ